jgi:hypothetical protein
MPRKIKIYACDRDHKIISDAKNEKRFAKGKMVCGTCGNRFAEFKSASWNTNKHFLCENGHIVTIGVFKNGMCNLSWGNGQTEFINEQISPEAMSAKLKAAEVRCPVGGSCNKVLVPLEDCNLQIPQIMGIKTKTRVGDVWDKNRCPRPTAGSYDENFNFKDSKFTKINKERVKSLKKTRNTRPAGEVVERPTERSYRQGARRPTKADL